MSILFTNGQVDKSTIDYYISDSARTPQEFLESTTGTSMFKPLVNDSLYTINFEEVLWLKIDIAETLKNLQKRDSLIFKSAVFNEATIFYEINGQLDSLAF